MSFFKKCCFNWRNASKVCKCMGAKIYICRMGSAQSSPIFIGSFMERVGQFGGVSWAEPPYYGFLNVFGTSGVFPFSISAPTSAELWILFFFFFSPPHFCIF